MQWLFKSQETSNPTKNLNLVACQALARFWSTMHVDNWKPCFKL
jgi:hypothetical protein